MMVEEGMNPELEPCIFVEGPRRASAEFYGKWLLGAAKADEVWKKAKEEPRYKKQLEQVPINYVPAFGVTALWLVSQLANNSLSAIVSVNGREEEMRGWFLTMRHMDFFCYLDKRYEMILPPSLEYGKC
jgi:hypothetical protein